MHPRGDYLAAFFPPSRATAVELTGALGIRVCQTNRKLHRLRLKCPFMIDQLLLRGGSIVVPLKSRSLEVNDRREAAWLRPGDCRHRAHMAVASIRQPEQSTISHLDTAMNTFKC